MNAKSLAAEPEEDPFDAMKPGKHKGQGLGQGGETQTSKEGGHVSQARSKIGGRARGRARGQSRGRGRPAGKDMALEMLRDLPSDSEGNLTQSGKLSQQDWNTAFSPNGLITQIECCCFA